MPDETDKAISERIHAIFPSKEIAARIADLVINKRPIGVSKRAYYPYYKETHASMVRGPIDKMILSRESIIFRYAEFCEGASAMSENTLYNMVMQATRYLVECMDTPEMKYRAWRASVRFHRSKSRGGVCIDFKPEFRAHDNKDLGELVIAPEDGTPKWKIEMDNWLESDDKKPFIREHMTLSAMEVKDLKMEILELKGIMGSIDCTSIKLMKVNA
jgi:hypothetical protein